MLCIYKKESLYIGRIRVQLKNDDGTAFLPEFPTRDSILLHLGRMIPQLKSRQSIRTADGGAQAQQNPSGAGGKKGKGKRR